MGRSTPLGPNDSRPDNFSLRSMRGSGPERRGGVARASRAVPKPPAGSPVNRTSSACQAMFDHCAIVYAIAPCIVRLAGAISAIRVGHSPRAAHAARGVRHDAGKCSWVRQRWLWFQACPSNAKPEPPRRWWRPCGRPSTSTVPRWGPSTVPGCASARRCASRGDYVPKPPFVVDDRTAI